MQPIPGIRFTFAKPGAGRSGIPYLALHPMGFSVPRCLRFARCALTAPFHPYRQPLRAAGGLIFCGTVRRKVFQLSARVYLRSKPELRGVAPDGVRTFLPRLAPGAILRPSKTSDILIEICWHDKPGSDRAIFQFALTPGLRLVGIVCG